jgi:hypothetical protein
MIAESFFIPVLKICYEKIYLGRHLEVSLCGKPAEGVDRKQVG